MKANKIFEPLPKLLRLSLQNMSTLAFVNLSLFLDRVILAKHSTESLNASVSAGAIASTFIFGAIAVGSISEMFLAKTFGAGRQKEIGPILWQMMWFSLIVACLFQFIAYFLSPLLIPSTNHSEAAQTYFSWQMSVGFLPVIIVSLNAFFIGIQRFGSVLLAVSFAGALKICCAIPLVLGIEGVFVGLGLKGAVISSAISQICHIVFLLVLIRKAGQGSAYGLGNFQFNLKLFVEMMRVGFPQALGCMLNYAAWGLVVSFLAVAGEKHLMMYTVIDSFYVLFGFTTEGLQKSVLSMGARFVGAGRRADLPSIITSAYLVLFLILLLLTIPMMFFAKDLAGTLNHGVLSMGEFSLACFIVWLYFLFDGVGWILNGSLTSLGDTFFANPVSGISSLVFGAGSTYLMTDVCLFEPSITGWVSIFYGIANVLLLSFRLRQWKLGQAQVESRPKPSESHCLAQLSFNTLMMKTP